MLRFKTPLVDATWLLFKKLLGKCPHKSSDILVKKLPNSFHHTKNQKLHEKLKVRCRHKSTKMGTKTAENSDTCVSNQL